MYWKNYFVTKNDKKITKKNFDKKNSNLTENFYKKFQFKIQKKKKIIT